MLQTFTYSTGLAFTGRSAACAPATATRPAAEPRRRLFTIFIVTSKFPSWEGSARRMREHPGRSPTVPRETTWSLFLTNCGAILEPWRGDLGMPPSVARSTLIKGPAHTIKKPPSHSAGIAFSGGCCTNGTRHFTHQGTPRDAA